MTMHGKNIILKLFSLNYLNRIIKGFLHTSFLLFGFLRRRCFLCVCLNTYRKQQNQNTHLYFSTQKQKISLKFQYFSNTYDKCFFLSKSINLFGKIFFSLIVHVSLCIHVSVAMNSVIHFTILMPANFYKVQLFNTEKQTKQKKKIRPNLILLREVI